MAEEVEAEMPFTGKHLKSIITYVENPQSSGFFGGKLIALADLVSLQAECRILEAVALAADKVENPSTDLTHALNRLHRRGQVQCPSCGMSGTPFPSEDPMVKCGNCGHEFSREEGAL